MTQTALKTSGDALSLRTLLTKTDQTIKKPPGGGLFIGNGLSA